MGAGNGDGRRLESEEDGRRLVETCDGPGDYWDCNPRFCICRAGAGNGNGRRLESEEDGRRLVETCDGPGDYWDCNLRFCICRAGAGTEMVAASPDNEVDNFFEKAAT